MNYLLMTFSVVMFFLLVFRVSKTEGSPDFRLKGSLNTRTLNLEINRVASECVNFQKKGGALSLSLIKRYINRAYGIIGTKIRSGEECFDFENRIYDGWFSLNNAIKRVRESSVFHKLPHVGGVPRIYRLCEILVKGLDGRVDEVVFACAVKRFNDIAPLNFDEICALPVMMDFCLLEYVAIFASKSVKINKNIEKSYKDAKKDRLDLSSINYNSYAYGYYDFAKEGQKSRLAAFCVDNGLPLETRIDNFLVQIARYGGAMQAALDTLLKKDSLITDKLLMELNPACNVLNGNSSFSKSKLPTKYVMAYYLSKRAKKEKISESALAVQLTERAEREQRDIGEYLLPRPKSKGFMRLYIGIFLLLSVSLSVVLAVLGNNLRIMTGIVFFPISFGLFLRLADIINGKLNDRRYLPRKDFRFIDREEARTMLVYTSLVGNEREVEELFQSLKTLKVANPDKIFVYSLLLDLPSSGSQTDKRDEAILKAIREKYNLLKGDRFSVFVRRRVRAGENEYRGWEKKRGALLELNNYLINGDESPFLMKLGERPTVKYVLTLDSDTMINCATELVEIMEHPYNADKSVVSLSMKTNPGEIMTPFAALMCGSVGLTNYSSAMTNPNFDIFGSGNYTGKGIYRLNEFNRAVSQAFMDNRLLSHDFIEGAVAGCANADLNGIDCFPSNYSSFLKRKMRWLRGDWQLLPYIFSKTKNRKGERVKNPLSPIAKWHIACNIICSLASISALILIIQALLTGDIYFLVLSLSLKLLGVLNGIRSSVLRRNSLLKNITAQLVDMMMLPLEAYYSISAIVVTLVRLARKKNLLSWNVFAHSSGRISFFPTVLVSSFILVYNAIFTNSVWFYLIVILFMSGIIFDFITSREYKEWKYDEKTLDDLGVLARSTYKYFEDMEKPCDNFQEGLGYAKRTSPTNLGYSIVAHICGYRLGFADYAACKSRIDGILNFVEGVKKWNGNLYNWYSSDGDVLYPSYVSTVDNGNLAFSLMLLGEELSEYKSRTMTILDEMKLEKLYDSQRGLFYIGYNDTSKQMDASHYDLLASESQLTYQAAIVLNKVDRGCFDNLSRKKVRYRGDTLYSWSGGLFEYLMGDLFVPYPKSTLLYNSAANAIKSHIKYAKNNKFVSWGWSESLYKSTDDNGWYQYKPFGVERIAVNDTVFAQSVSSYSSFLSLRFSPRKALENLNNLKVAGMQGEYGFYESLDGEPIKSFMTHHQGMVLMALTRAIKKDAFSLFDGCAFVSASKILLSIEDDGKIPPKKANLPTARRGLPDREIRPGHVCPPQYNFLTNGRFFSVENACGKGYSFFDGKYVGRYSSYSDGVRIGLCVNGEDKGEALLKSSAVFSSYDSRFVYEDEAVELKCTHFVLPYFNGDMRLFTVKNKTQKEIEVSISVNIELSMTDINKDSSHKTFSQMFIYSSYDAGIDAPVFFRTDEKPRMYFSAFFDKSALYCGNHEKGEKFGELPLPMSKATVTLSLSPYAQSSARFSTIVSYDLEYLKRSVMLIKTVGFEKRIEGAVYALKSFNPSFETAAKASLIMHERAFVPDELKFILNVNRPILSFLVSGDKSFSRLTYQLKELCKLYKFGLEFNVAVICKESEGYYKLVSEGVRNIFDSIGIEKLTKSCRAIIMDYDDKLSKIILNSSLYTDYVIHRPIEHSVSKGSFTLPTAPMPQLDIRYKTYKGGFLKDGGFVVEDKPPRPWSNVISTEGFGCIVTDSGGGYTFMKNSREEKLTRWNNDVISDRPSESVFFEDDLDFWGATRSPIQKNCDYKTLHYPGKSVFLCNYNGLLSKVAVFVSSGIKYYKITLNSQIDRQIRVMLCADFVLGDDIINTKNNLEFSFDGAIKATNLRSGLTAYLQCSKSADYTYYREGFCDISGSPVTCMLKKEGVIPFPALSANISLKKGEDSVIFFALGEKTDFGVDEPEVKPISALRIESGIPELDHLCQWLPYQILFSRFYSRAGYYQAGGAIGFRDQLQDCLALLYVDPSLVRRHILTCACHQFKKGDVQHWWHYDCTGVRTTIMDDRLYLPLAVAEYISFTGDGSVLDELTPYLNDVSIREGSGDVYATPGFSLDKDSVYDHCIKAIYSALEFGENGLLLIRGGDWNDGMNKVGVKGNGTTVWGSMFAYYVIDKFLPYCSAEDKKILNSAKGDLRRGVSRAYNGSWFVRAYADDGSVLGDESCKECKIDLITQAFSVISGVAEKKQAKSAMESAYELLVDRENGIIKLLDPPLKEFDAGYISLYPAGVRENGGQYTHGAVWYIWALFEAGEAERAYELLEMINPVYKCREGGDGEVYKIEPYVIAADVYAGKNVGQGGWSWYTGSAAWYYRCVVEQLLGIRIKGDYISFNPKLPTKIKEPIKVDYTTKYGIQKIEIDNSGEGDFEMKVGKIRYSSLGLKISGESVKNTIRIYRKQPNN